MIVIPILAVLVTAVIYLYERFVDKPRRERASAYRELEINAAEGFSSDDGFDDEEDEDDED